MKILFKAFLVLCILLPFQFALNPLRGVDLAIIRIAIPILFIIIFLFFFAKREKPLFKYDLMLLLLIAFLFLSTISLFFSENTAWSLRKLLFFLSIFPIYPTSILLFKNGLEKRAVVTALVLGGSAIAIVGISQFLSQFIFGIDRIYSLWEIRISPFFLGNSFSQAVLEYPSWLVNSSGNTYLRAFAFFPDPHMFSYYMGMLLPWSVALWATSRQHKKAFLLSSILLIFANIFTFTRGGYVALIISILVILPMVSKKNAFKLLLAAIMLVFALLTVPNNPVIERLASSFDTKEGSNQGRISNWHQALGIISKNPMGVGIGNYSLAIKSDAGYREPIYAHNVYLDIAAELGIASLIVFIAILLISFRSFWLLKKGNSLFIAGISSVSIFAVHSLVENPLFSVHILPLFLIILALGTQSKHDEKISNS